MLTKTIETPYYAVIFSSIKEDDFFEYNEMAKKMEELAANQDGFLGMDSARDEVGITVSYWKDLESISNWKKNAQHQIAMEFGKKKWYKNYVVRICKVEKAYEFER